MTDRVQLIIDLGTLATEAALRGDDRAADILRRAVGFTVKADADLTALDVRRAADRDRPRRTKKSTESAEVRGIRGTSAPVSTQNLSVVPELQQQLREDDDYSAREVRRIHGTEIDEAIQALLDLLRGAVGDALFPAADEFIRRRPYRTWKGWLDEMLTTIGPGSQFTAEDLARVCRDDAALDRPLASPRGLRSFLSNARIERMAHRDAHVPAADAGQVVAKIRGLVKQNPGRGNYLPKTDVEALGPAVLRAYESVGGADRFLNIQPKDLPFLIKAFGDALRGAA